MSGDNVGVLYTKKEKYVCMCVHLCTKGKIFIDTLGQTIDLVI